MKCTTIVDSNQVIRQVVGGALGRHIESHCHGLRDNELEYYVE